MKKLILAAILLVLLVGSFLAGSWWRDRKDVKGNPSSSRSREISSDKRPDTDTNTDTSSSIGTVRITPERQQVTGVRIGQVEKTAQRNTIRTLGRVAADDTRIYRINIAVDGWIEKTFDNSTGSLVKKDENLATFYSPEFLAAEQAYIYALSSLDRFQASGKERPDQINLTKTNVQQYKDSLRNLGMGAHQIEEIGRTHQFTENINIASPVTGFILSSQRFARRTI